MSDGTLPGTGPSVRAADLDRAAGWLRRHRLAGVLATPLLAARLAIRRRARLAAHLMAVPEAAARYGVTPGWWNDARLACTVLGCVGFALVQVGTACTATVARRTTGVTAHR